MESFTSKDAKSNKIVRLLFTLLLPVFICPLAPNAYAINCATAMVASSEADLNSAIACFNSSGSNATITLDSDITSTGGFSAIGTGLGAAQKLLIKGDGRTVSSQTQSNLFVINGGNVSITELAISNTTGTPLRVTNGSLLFKDSTIDNNSSAGVYASGGSLVINNSTISNGNSSGIYVDGGNHKILQSTISGNRLNGVVVNSGSMLVSNSTVTDNRIGVLGSAGLVSIANSTVAYNNDNGIEADGASIKVYSSLVAFNAQSGPYADCLQFSGSLQFVGKSASSYESDGTCLPFSNGSSLSSSTLQTGDLQPLDSISCARQQATANGGACLAVHGLSGNSVAADKGDCRAASAQPAIPAASIDARSISRASPCDSGAVEAQVVVGVPVLISPMNFQVELAASPVTVTFSAVTGASQYQVQVYDRAAQAWTFVSIYNSAVICGNGSCNADTTSLVPQNYAVWRVRAYSSTGWGAWSGFAVFNVSAEDTQPPTATIDSPSVGSTVPLSPSLSGTIIDTGGSGVANLSVVIWRFGSGSFVTLDGTPTAWTQFAATLPSGNPDSANWTLSTSLPEGDYIAYTYASDASGNYSAANRVSRTFTVSAPDTTAPTASIATPVSNAEITSSPQITGAINDTGGSGVARLAVVIWKEGAGFVDLNSASTVWRQFDATLPAGNPDTAQWSLATSLAAGTYRVFTYAYDAAGNHDSANRVIRRFTIQ